MSKNCEPSDVADDEMLSRCSAEIPRKRAGVRRPYEGCDQSDTQPDSFQTWKARPLAPPFFRQMLRPTRLLKHLLPAPMPLHTILAAPFHNANRFMHLDAQYAVHSQADQVLPCISHNVKA